MIRFDSTGWLTYHTCTYLVNTTYVIRGTMKTVTVTKLRADIYNLLEEVLTTGVALEVKKGSRRLRVVPVERANKLNNLINRPEIIQGDPDDLVSMQWEVNLDLS